MKRNLLLVLCLFGIGCGLEQTSTNAAAQKKGEKVILGALSSRVPMDWESQKPKSRLRMYQFRLPKAKGSADAELAIFFFGKGGGGGIEANLARWKGKFQKAKTKVEKFKVGNSTVTYLDISGTYLYKFPPFSPNAKITPKKDYRMFGVILANDEGPFFVTATGPAKTMAHHKKGFDKWLKSFK